MDFIIRLPGVEDFLLIFGHERFRLRLNDFQLHRPERQHVPRRQPCIVEPLAIDQGVVAPAAHPQARLIVDDQALQRLDALILQAQVNNVVPSQCCACPTESRSVVRS